MGLRGQLIGVGLLTLLLPWAAIQVIREMDQALRDGQIQRVQSLAEIVANRVVESRDILLFLDQTAQDTNAPTEKWYARLVATRPILDGYFDEWDTDNHSECRGLPGPIKGKHACSLVRTRGQFYLAVQVVDQSRNYANPAAPITASDHLNVFLESGGRVVREFVINSAAEGVAQVNERQSDGSFTKQHRVKAFWREREDGYNIELSLPLEWGSDGLFVFPYDPAQNHSEKPPSQLPKVILQHFDLTDLIGQFSRTDTRLTVVVAKRWIVAQVGSIQSEDNETWWKSVQNRLLKRTALEVWHHVDGSPEIQPALKTAGLNSNTNIFSDHSRVVARAVRPLDGYEEAGIYVVVEQTSVASDTITANLMFKLLFYSGLIGLLVSLVLLGFATLMSVRVRSLNRAVNKVVDVKGRITDKFTPSSMRDEIGELSRNYAVLLQRLEGYTQYLESLSQTLAHELRTPLAIVRSSLDNLADVVPKDAPTERYIHRATEGIERLAAILQAMSAASRIEQSVRDSEVTAVNLSELLENLISVYRDVYPQQPITSAIATSPNVWVLGNAELLAQMLDKLVENAVEYCDNKQSINISLKVVDQRAVLEVLNSGEPIPKALLDKLFDSLVTSGAKSEGKHHLGLGLYIVRLIAEFHGGAVDVDNRETVRQVCFRVQLKSLSAS